MFSSLLSRRFIQTKSSFVIDLDRGFPDNLLTDSFKQKAMDFSHEPLSLTTLQTALLTEQTERCPNICDILLILAQPLPPSWRDTAPSQPHSDTDSGRCEHNNKPNPQPSHAQWSSINSPLLTLNPEKTTDFVTITF